MAFSIHALPADDDLSMALSPVETYSISDRIVAHSFVRLSRIDTQNASDGFCLHSIPIGTDVAAFVCTWRFGYVCLCVSSHMSIYLPPPHRDKVKKSKNTLVSFACQVTHQCYCCRIAFSVRRVPFISWSPTIWLFSAQHSRRLTTKSFALFLSFLLVPLGLTSSIPDETKRHRFRWHGVACHLECFGRNSCHLPCQLLSRLGGGGSFTIMSNRFLDTTFDTTTEWVTN